MPTASLLPELAGAAPFRLERPTQAIAAAGMGDIGQLGGTASTPMTPVAPEVWRAGTIWSEHLGCQRPLADGLITIFAHGFRQRGGTSPERAALRNRLRETSPDPP